MLTSLHDILSWRCPADLNARSIAHRGVLHWGCYDCCHNLQLSVCSIWSLTFSEGRKHCFRTVKSFHQLKAMQLWGYSLTNVMINKLRISNTVCTSHRILLEHLGPNQETTDTGFPALKSKDVCASHRWSGHLRLPLQWTQHERGRYSTCAQYSQQSQGGNT